MTPEEMSTVLSLLTLIYSIVLVVAIALRQLVRLVRHVRAGKGVPTILKRDMIFFWGLVILIVIPSLGAIFDIVLTTFLPWVIVRSALGVTVLTIYAYYEFRVIGRQSKRDARDSVEIEGFEKMREERDRVEAGNVPD